jgi:hypothetical protein
MGMIMKKAVLFTAFLLFGILFAAFAPVWGV